MAVPKRKTTRSKRNMRRAHERLSAQLGVSCPECGAIKQPHHICNECGFYHGRSAIVVAKDDSSKEPSDTAT